MRVVDRTLDPLVVSVAAGGGRSRLFPANAGRASGAVRAANIEALGIVVCSIVVLFGLWLTAVGRREQLRAAGSPPVPVLNLRALHGPDDLLPLLSMFESPAERQTAARLLYRRAVSDDPPLDHVGGLSAVTIGADEIRRNPRFIELRARLSRRPGATQAQVLTAADLVALKPHLVVRTRDEYKRALLRACGLFLGAFWLAHVVRRWRRAEDDPLMLPILLLLSGIGLMCMVALRDPIRDTIPAATFATGVAIGLAVLVAAAEFDFEASPLRRAVIAPLGLALGLASMLLVFGDGPGSSGAKVNLLGFQPVEVIRLLVVFALAAYFARRLEHLRELSEPATPVRPWLNRISLPRWIDVRPVVVSMLVVLGFFFLQKDLGPALVLSCVVLALYAIARGRGGFRRARPGHARRGVWPRVRDRRAGDRAAACAHLVEPVEQRRPGRQPDRARIVGAGNGRRTRQWPWPGEPRKRFLPVTPISCSPLSANSSGLSGCPSSSRSTRC